MFTCGWLWLYFGLALMFLELLTPGFVVFFFGLSAATVGCVRMMLGEAFTPTWQISVFSALCIVYLIFLRRLLKKIFFGASETSATNFENELIGRIGTVTEAVKPPRTGRVLIGDSEWTAASNISIDVGDEVRVISRDNLTIKVEKI